MLLFGARRNEDMKRFLIDEGVGNDPRFRRLAQALTPLYPSSGNGKRWGDGIVARKKRFGVLKWGSSDLSVLLGCREQIPLRQRGRFLTG